MQSPTPSFPLFCFPAQHFSVSKVLCCLHIHFHCLPCQLNIHSVKLCFVHCQNTQYNTDFGIQTLAFYLAGVFYFCESQRACGPGVGGIFHAKQCWCSSVRWHHRTSSAAQQPEPHGTSLKVKNMKGEGCSSLLLTKVLSVKISTGHSQWIF